MAVGHDDRRSDRMETLAAERDRVMRREEEIPHKT
jgi:hypothetical protein